MAAQRDVGDRLERAIEDRADLEGEIARGEAAGPPERRDLEKLAPAWLVAMAVLQALAIASLCALQRLAVRAKRWGPVVTSQLVGNAMAKIAPGGGAVGAAVQYRMLVDAGLNGATVVGGLTVANLLVFAFVLAMPMLAIPGGRPRGRPPRPRQRDADRRRRLRGARRPRPAVAASAAGRDRPLGLRLRDAARRAGRRRALARAG